jgi:DNA-directed RNA polymerase subunit omega
MEALSLLPEIQGTTVDSRSRLVIIAAQRARQLMQGVTPTVITKHIKPTTIALEEVLRGRVPFLVGKEARQAMKEAKKQRERELERLTIPPVVAEDASEIKKDLSVIVDDSPKTEVGEEG